jgi:hypothetical protein
MPTVLMISGMRVTIYPNDHRPAHVHVIGGGCESVFDLQCPQGPPVLRENYGFSRKVLNGLQSQLESHLYVLCNAWIKIHGNF